MHVEDPGTEAAHFGMLLRRFDQLVEQHRIDFRVVVQHKNEVGTPIERVADAQVVAPGISEIAAGLNDVKL